MSKYIIKAPYINFDSENIKSIDIPSKNQFVEDNELYEQPKQPTTLLKDEETRQSIIETAEKKALSIIKNAEKKASSIINDAHNESSTIIENAKKEAERESIKIKDTAHESGYKNGYDEGIKKSKKIINEANTTLSNARSEKQQTIDNLEPEMINLIISICDKLISDLLEINPKVISYLIKNGLNLVTITGNINIHVSQYDYEYALENKQMIQSFIEGSPNLEIIKDFSLNKGDCIIETPLGSIDSSLGIQLDALKQDLYIILNNR